MYVSIRSTQVRIIMEKICLATLIFLISNIISAQTQTIDLGQYVRFLCGEVERGIQAEDARLKEADCDCQAEGNIVTIDCQDENICVELPDGSYVSGQLKVENVLEVDLDGATDDVDVLIARLIAAQAQAQIKSCRKLSTNSDDSGEICIYTTADDNASCLVTVGEEECTNCTQGENLDFRYSCSNRVDVEETQSGNTTFASIDFSNSIVDKDLCSAGSSRSLSLPLASVSVVIPILSILSALSVA